MQGKGLLLSAHGQLHQEGLLLLVSLLLLMCWAVRGQGKTHVLAECVLRAVAAFSPGWHPVPGHPPKCQPKEIPLCKAFTRATTTTTTQTHACSLAALLMLMP
jgi:hypothetical protein